TSCWADIYHSLPTLFTGRPTWRNADVGHTHTHAWTHTNTHTHTHSYTVCLCFSLSPSLSHTFAVFEAQYSDCVRHGTFVKVRVSVSVSVCVNMCVYVCVCVCVCVCVSAHRSPSV